MKWTFVALLAGFTASAQPAVNQVTNLTQIAPGVFSRVVTITVADVVTNRMVGVPRGVNSQQVRLGTRPTAMPADRWTALTVMAMGLAAQGPGRVAVLPQDFRQAFVPAATQPPVPGWAPIHVEFTKDVLDPFDPMRFVDITDVTFLQRTGKGVIVQYSDRPGAWGFMADWTPYAGPDQYVTVEWTYGVEERRRVLWFRAVEYDPAQPGMMIAGINHNGHTKVRRPNGQVVWLMAAKPGNRIVVK